MAAGPPREIVQGGILLLWATGTCLISIFVWWRTWIVNKYIYETIACALAPGRAED